GGPAPHARREAGCRQRRPPGGLRRRLTVQPGVQEAVRTAPHAGRGAAARGGGEIGRPSTSRGRSTCTRSVAVTARMAVFTSRSGPNWSVRRVPAWERRRLAGIGGMDRRDAGRGWTVHLPADSTNWPVSPVTLCSGDIALPAGENAAMPGIHLPV